LLQKEEEDKILIPSLENEKTTASRFLPLCLTNKVEDYG